MTEQEAKTKWCPMAQFQTNRWFEVEEDNPSKSDKCQCIASDCMMWRFDKYKWTGSNATTVPPHEVKYWCGLGGKPE